MHSTGSGMREAGDSTGGLMRKPGKAWNEFVNGCDGATLMEYALLASLAVVVLSTALLAVLGPNA